MSYNQYYRIIISIISMPTLTLQHPAPPSRDPDIRKLIVTWQHSLSLQALAGEISDNTRQAYMRGFNRFLDWAMTSTWSRSAPTSCGRGSPTCAGADTGRRRLTHGWPACGRFFSWAVTSGD